MPTPAKAADTVTTTTTVTDDDDDTNTTTPAPPPAAGLGELLVELGTAVFSGDARNAFLAKVGAAGL